METSNNESNIASSETASSEEVCVLRRKLNVNCLLEVFEYLEPSDLIKLCKMDTFFKELITRWTLKKKMIYLPFVWMHFPNQDHTWMRERLLENIEIFEVFGKSLQKLNAEYGSLQFLLKSIVQCCEPAKLTDIDWRIICFSIETFRLDGNLYLPVDQNLLDQSMPFFSNLRKLRFDYNIQDTFESNASDQEMVRNFLTKITISATNLKILKVLGFDIKGAWCKNMQNLCKLRIEWSNDSSFDDLVSCLKMNPKLKVFKVSYMNDLTTIRDVLSESCPYLEYFSHSHYENPYYRFGDAMINRYTFLSTFPHLNRVSLSSLTICCSDLYYPLTTLAKRKIVYFKIYRTNSNGLMTLNKDVVADIMQRPLPDFINLQTIVIDENFSDKFYDDSDSNYQFVFHFVKHAKNLQKIKFRSFEIKDMHTFLEFAPSIKTFDLSRYELGSESIKNIVETLHKIRQFNNIQHLLHLVLHWTAKPNFTENWADDTKEIINISYRNISTFYYTRLVD